MTLDSTLKYKTPQYMKLAVAFLSLGIALGLCIWSLFNYRPAPTIYGPRAIYSVMFLSITLVLLGRYLLLRMIKRESGVTQLLYHQLPRSWQTLFLFDITAPIYLAAGVLVGVSAGVLTALITQIALQLFTYKRRFVSLVEACYRIASTAVVVLIADTIFTLIAGTQHQVTSGYSPHSESKELIGCIVAAVVMLLLIILASLPALIPSRSVWGDRFSLPDSLRATVVTRWRAYLRSPVLLFQILVLSVGPLLPVVDIYDNFVAEVAWLFFLVPLFAIYYLALVSTRLSIRTDALQETLTDLSSARRRQDELRDYATLITRVQEEERRRLARELHDDTAQALIALALGLDGLGRAIGKLDLPEKDREWLASLQNLADHTLEGVRRACRDLRPSVLDDLGLRAALEWLSDSSFSRGVPCTFTCRGTPVLTTSEDEIVIFRIAQEALSNIWRHSGATQASVELINLPERLQLAIHDNGSGFVLQRSLSTLHDPQGGLGLVGMRERAALIGATLTIKSSPDNGCHVELSLPITPSYSLEESPTTSSIFHEI
ncbi:MAG TPA: sensor histidine kinase [Ktedonobacteraceae bacterium]|nr:sensor histidine kinase [Ktedonobacteraceae bacterium]